MAVAADLDPDIFFRRARIDNVATGTRYRSLEVFRMNTFTHRSNISQTFLTAAPTAAES